MYNLRHLSYLYFLILIFFPTKSFSQDWNLLFTLETDAEFYMADGNYSRAADTYLKALKKYPESCNLMFKVGYCLLKTDDRKAEALSYLEEAAKKVSDKYDARSLKEANSPPEVLYHLGISYMHQNNFDKAKAQFEAYKKYVNPNDAYVLQQVEQNIKSCETAKAMMDSPIGLNLNRLEEGVNNDQSNFDAVLSGDGKTMAFTSRSTSGNKVFISFMDKGKWSIPKDITRNLGSSYLTTSFLSYNGEELYLIDNDLKNSEIVVSFLQKNKWSNPVKAAKPINSKANETHVCVTRDGNTAYFTSDRKGGQGGFDIYKVTISGDKWGEPVNLGPNINTPLDEATPFLTPDEKYLFFSSQGHNSMGGYDIFYVNLEGSSNVKNIGYPLNTPDDNLFYFPTSLTSGYISTFSPNGLGGLDICSVEIIPQVDVKINIMLADKAPADKSYTVSIIDTKDGKPVSSVNQNGKKQILQKLSPGTFTVAASGVEFDSTSSLLEIPSKPDKNEYQISLLLNPSQPKPEPVAEVSQPANDIPIQKEVKPVPVVVEEPKSEKPVPVSVEKPKQEKSTVASVPVNPSPKPEVKKREMEKPRPVHVAVTNLSLAAGTSTSLAHPTYSVQLMACKQPVDYDYFKLDSIFVSISPEGYYRYSVGYTLNVQQAEELLARVKTLGYTNAYVRINKEQPSYTIQLMALTKPKRLNQLNVIGSTMVYRGCDGTYRYCTGSYSTPEEAQNDLASFKNAGYSDAFIRHLGR